MVKFIIKRIALMFPLLIVVSFMTFMMTYLTKGDPAVTILHAQGTPNITPQLIAETREKYGFNEPILIQYMNWLIEAIQFKFGSSYITRESVSERIGPAFFNTFKLTLISSISVIITSILLGVISALTKGKLTDRIIRSIAFFLTALPSYWIASMLIIYISVKLNVLPTSGLTGPESYILPVLVVLTLISSISVIITSILLGVISALTKGKLTDRIIRSIAFFLTALPSYWIASMLIIYISVKLNVLPTSGLTGPESYILPVLVVTITYAGIYFRNVRRAMIEQLNEGYVLYLRASGVHTLTLLSHVLRNALQVAVSIFCMSVPMIMGGLVVIENVFAWPGLGQLSIKAIVEHDFPVIQAYVLIVAVLFIIFNTLADIINAYLNPKLREAI